jgi:[ribosomal protein S18]-alanine N-acetyltransferase
VDKNQSITIQRMSFEDILQTQLLIRQLNLGSWSVEDLKREVIRSDSLSFITKNNGIITGFIISRLIMQIVDDILYDSEIEIYNIGVKVEYRRKGIGLLLIKKLLQETASQNLRCIWLEVRQSNSVAINFYQSNFFKFCYRRKKFYSNPTEDALVLKLEV